MEEHEHCGEEKNRRKQNTNSLMEGTSSTVSNSTSKICTEEEKSFKEQEEQTLIVKADGNLANIKEKPGNHPSIRNRSKSGEFKCNECEYSSHRKQLLKFHYE